MSKSKQVTTALIAFSATTLMMYAMLAGVADQRLQQADWWNHPLAWMCSVGLGLVAVLIAYTGQS